MELLTCCSEHLSRHHIIREQGFNHSIIHRYPIVLSIGVQYLPVPGEADGGFVVDTGGELGDRVGARDG